MRNCTESSFSVVPAGGNRFLRRFLKEPGSHFLLFLLLGIFVSLWMKEQSIAYFLKPVTVSFFICAIYAVTDEIHQEFFVEGRAFELIDLAKDWSGSLLGCIAVRLGAIREEK